jgi:hypothetical protein
VEAEGGSCCCGDGSLCPELGEEVVVPCSLLPLLLLLSLTERSSNPATTAGLAPLLLFLLPPLNSLPFLLPPSFDAVALAGLLPAASDAHEGAPWPTATGFDDVIAAALAVDPSTPAAGGAGAPPEGASPWLVASGDGTLIVVVSAAEEDVGEAAAGAGLGAAFVGAVGAAAGAVEGDFASSGCCSLVVSESAEVEPFVAPYCRAVLNG